MTEFTPNEPAPFEYLQPLVDQLLTELTERLYLSRESAPASYHALANSLTLTLLMTRDGATGTENSGGTASNTTSPARNHELTAPLVWLIKRLLTDHTYRAAQLAIHRDKLTKCYYTAPRLFVAKPPVWLPASAYLMARADLDLYPKDGKWWESDHWLTLKEPQLLAVLVSRLDHLLSELAQEQEEGLLRPQTLLIGQSGSGVTQSHLLSKKRDNPLRQLHCKAMFPTNQPSRLEPDQPAQQ